MEKENKREEKENLNEKKKDNLKCNNSCNDCAISFNLEKIGMPHIYYRHLSNTQLRRYTIKIMLCGCHKRAKARERIEDYEYRKTKEYLENIGYKIKYGETGYILRK